MFWRFGGYANISTIDTILDKADFQLEDLLDESDLIQELKQHNTKLLEYLRQDHVLAKLLDYVVAPKLEAVEDPEDDTRDDDASKKGRSLGLGFGRPRASSRATSDGNDDEESEKKRNRYAYVAAEVLSSDNWSIHESLMENQLLLRNFWSFLKLPAPLDPLQASYFTKVNESLFDKKTHDMLDLFRSLDDVVPNILRHVDCPMVMDLLLKIISLEKSEDGQGIVEWLYTKDIIPSLLSFLGTEYNWSTQTAAGDFIKAIITVSANASQNEQACIGPNELTRQLVSKPCVERIISYMLGGGNPLTVGVGVIIEVIRKNNSDYDPDVGTGANILPSSRDPIYLGTLLRLFAEHVPDFMSLVLNAPAQNQRLDSTFGDKIEPLGFDRFKTCELMAELLHCSNMALLNEPGSEQLIARRDDERRRLRLDGRLSATRGEEAPSASSDDLTMRARQSPPEENRRLEVMNASDDDGFEEVTSSGDMTEDTSHEFVKAEDEIPIPATASFIEKDDDDFVDEPLSSPRLNFQDETVHEQQFEMPELVVAPLSPKKQSKLELEFATDRVELDSPPKNGEPTMGITIQASTPSEVLHASVKDEPESTAGAQPSAPETSTGPLPGTEATASQVKEAMSELDDAIKVDSAPVSSKPTPEVPQTPQDVSVGQDIKGEPSSHNDQPPEKQTPDVDLAALEAAAAQTDPVVGDFLKMQFVKNNVVPTILSFFFRYPWNNFLHNVVYDIVQQVFNGPMDHGFNPTLAISLFEAADITNAIINGQLSSEKSQAQSKTRMGFMGHLTLIAEEVVKFTERNPPELLSKLVVDRVMSQDWVNYVEGALAETRERDNAVLGGVRPEVALGNRQVGGSLGGMGISTLGLGASSITGSNALAEAGLNGGGNSMDMPDHGSGSSLGPFSISSGLISGSGFGSSSDEDEDEPEDDEDVNHEFRTYTDSLNPSSSSMDPPSIPPPPPPPAPLNIPPSRARLQLAARLAMHQKSAATIASQSAGTESKQQEEDTKRGQGSDRVLRDPFADDGEDDVDDSDDDIGDDGGNVEPWGAGASRGSWWRNTLRPNREKFGDGRDDSDSGQEDQAEAEDDEDDFGDFAMPETDNSNERRNASVIVKPLPVHPPQNNPKTSAFTSLWPFGSKEKDKPKGDDSGAATEAGADGADEHSTKIKATHEAIRRMSIEEPDEDEVVI
ncbi:SAPS-domain-containing protein [Xylaria sp. CBS 124048]|nr:SAPS-domain-containing protein [Xylaria sp. CBS 124048]